MDTCNDSLAKVPEALGVTKPAKSDARTDGPGFLYLGGGGSAEDEANVWNEAFKSGQRIVIWPFAQPRDCWAGTLAWFTGAMAARGELSTTSVSGSITLADLLPGGGLEEAEIVLIPGGNTFELLGILRSHGLLKNLEEFLAMGGKLYGGSAGAILVGADIGLADVERGGLDKNTIGLQDTQGMGLIGDIAVYPHWEQQGAEAGYERWAKEKSLRVLGLPENSGVVIDLAGRKGINKGPADIILFSPDGGNRKLKVGESFVF